MSSKKAKSLEALLSRNKYKNKFSTTITFSQYLKLESMNPSTRECLWTALEKVERKAKQTSFKLRQSLKPKGKDSFECHRNRDVESIITRRRGPGQRTLALLDSRLQSPTSSVSLRFLKTMTSVTLVMASKTTTSLSVAVLQTRASSDRPSRENASDGLQQQHD